MRHPLSRPAELPVTRGLRLPFRVSVLIAALLVVASVAGLAFGQRGLYELNLATLPAFLAQDILSLAAGVPLLLGSAWLARRGSLRGLLLWMGSLFYLSYAYSFYILGDRLAPLFLMYAAIVSMSLYCLVYLLLSTDSDGVRRRFSERTPTRWAGGFVAVMGVLMAMMWVVAIVAAVLSGTLPTRVQLVVWPLDLVVAFPALFWGGVWLWRREPLGYVVGGIVLLKAAVEGLTLVIQTWATQLMGGPDDPLVPVYALVGLGGLALLVLYLRGVTTR